MQNAVNPNATPKAQELLNYLCQIAGKKIITGQHTQTNPMEELDYIKNQTGFLPKLIGFELLAYSPNINYSNASEECLTEVEQNKETLKTALRLAKNSDAIITFSFHWFSPLGGKDKSFYAKNTDFDPEMVLVQNSEERKAFFNDLDKIAKELEVFNNADIPILWRPFHESDGEWFWWGRKGSGVAKELYKLMFDYFVNEKKLNNLIWVWNCRNKEGYPGDEFVDVISVDIYLEKYEATDYVKDYASLIEETTKNKVAALGEVGYIPNIEILQNSKTPWAYYMTWSKEFCIGEKYNSSQNLKAMFQSEYSVKM